MTSRTPPPPSDSAGSLFGRPREEVERALPRREAIVCPLCRTVPRRFAVDFQGLSLARCATCALEFHSPRPHFQDLATAVYGASYHSPDQSLVDPARAYQFERQLRWLEQALPPDGARRLLDVGCGAGAFIAFARRRGWVVEGTDVVITEPARATGVRIREGELPSIVFGDERYDVVRFNHVLEHTQDPLAELRAARARLVDGGVLHIGVPNLAGLTITLKSWQSRLGLKAKTWKHYGALHHLWFFTPSTLTRLVEAAGFQPLGWETPVPPRPGRPSWMTALVRVPLERARLGGVVDLYARRAPASEIGQGAAG